jgi:hypothetical protein
MGEVKVKMTEIGIALEEVVLNRYNLPDILKLTQKYPYLRKLQV